MRFLTFAITGLCCTVSAAQAQPRSVEVSAAISVLKTPCFEKQGGGPICHGSLVGADSSHCYLESGCTVDFLGLALSMAGNLSDRVAVVGELGVYRLVELTNDSGASFAAGPRLRAGPVFGQVLVGAESHQIFPSGLIIRPGVGIDLKRARLEVDYSYLPGNRSLSGLRVVVGFVWRVAS